MTIYIEEFSVSYPKAFFSEGGEDIIVKAACLRVFFFGYYVIAFVGFDDIFDFERVEVIFDLRVCEDDICE